MLRAPLISSAYWITSRLSVCLTSPYSSFRIDSHLCFGFNLSHPGQASEHTATMPWPWCLPCSTHLLHPFPRQGRDLPAYPAHLCQLPLTEMQALGRHVARGNAALSEHLLLASLSMAQSRLFCTSIHSCIVFTSFSHVHRLLFLLTPLSFGEREWLEIYFFRSKAAIPKYICMYVFVQQHT